MSIAGRSRTARRRPATSPARPFEAIERNLVQVVGVAIALFSIVYVVQGLTHGHTVWWIALGHAAAVEIMVVTQL